MKGMRAPRTLWLVLFASVTMIAPRLLAAPPPGKGGGPNDDGPPPDFAFAFYNASDRSIYLTNIDDTQRRRLTESPRRGADISPTWSPDLEPLTDGYQGKVAFFRRPDKQYLEGDLYTINPDGSNLQLIAPLRWGRDPVPWDQNGGKETLAWSPNGQEIVFVYDRCLWAVEVSSGAYRCLFTSDMVIADPSISAVNQQIVFYSFGDLEVVDFSFDANGLMVVDETTRTNLTGDWNLVIDEHPKWSPDGLSIAFQREDQLVVLDYLTGDELVLIPAAYGGEPTWSPDGLEIGYSNAADIFRVTNWWDSQRMQILPVTNTRKDERDPEWRPGWLGL